MSGAWSANGIWASSPRPPTASRLRRVLRRAEIEPPLFRRGGRQPDPARHHPGPGLGLPDRHARRRGRGLYPAARRPALLPLRAVHGDPHPAPGQARGAGAAGLHRRSEATAGRGRARLARRGVGTITAALRNAGVAGNTVVVFLGDNGCSTSTGCRNKPLRGGKGTWWEGGIRAPFMLSWPGQVTGGRNYTQPVMSFDLFATFVTAAGGTPGGVVDGVDLLPFLRGGPGVPHPYLFWGGGRSGRRARATGSSWAASSTTSAATSAKARTWPAPIPTSSPTFAERGPRGCARSSRRSGERGASARRSIQRRHGHAAQAA